MMTRRSLLLDAAIDVLGESGMHGLTHRAVDARADLPPGSTSNHFRTRDALLNAVVERFVIRERDNWERLAKRTCPTTPDELARVLARAAQESVGPQRRLTLARYAILVEAATHPALRDRLTVGGARVREYFLNWMRVSGAVEPERDAPLLMNYVAGLVLHQLANPDPDFDPTEELVLLVRRVIDTKG